MYLKEKALPPPPFLLPVKTFAPGGKKAKGLPV